MNIYAYGHHTHNIGYGVSKCYTSSPEYCAGTSFHKLRNLFLISEFHYSFEDAN